MYSNENEKYFNFEYWNDLEDLSVIQEQISMYWKTHLSGKAKYSVEILSFFQISKLWKISSSRGMRAVVNSFFDPKLQWPRGVLWVI